MRLCEIAGNKYGRVYVWSLSGLFDSERPVDLTERSPQPSTGKASQSSNVTAMRRSSRTRSETPQPGSKRKMDDTESVADHDNDGDEHQDQEQEQDHEHDHDHDNEHFDNSSNAHEEGAAHNQEEACASTDRSSSPMPDTAGGESVSSRVTSTTTETKASSSTACPPPLPAPASRQQSGGSASGRASSDHGSGAGAGTGGHMLKRTPREKFETGRAHRAPALLFHPKCTSVVRQTCFSADGRWLVFCCDDGTVWKYAVNCA